MMRQACLLILMTTIACGQGQVPSIQAESSGKCSPNILSNQGSVQFVCKTEMDGATAAKVTSLLNRILQQQQKSGDAEVNDKLDKILDFLRNEAKIHEPRVLPNDQLAPVEQALSAHPATFQIIYVLQDGEGYQLAKQISDVLVSSHWTQKEPPSGGMIGGEGGPLYGLAVAYRGDKAPHPGDRVPWSVETPQGMLTSVLSHYFPENFVLDPEPSIDPGFVRLFVYANPKSKPAPK